MRIRLKAKCFNSLTVENIENIQFLKDSTFNPRISDHNRLNLIILQINIAHIKKINLNKDFYN